MSTLIRPPPPNPHESPIESVLELLQLSDIDPVGPNLAWSPKYILSKLDRIYSPTRGPYGTRKELEVSLAAL
jgi:hypothetical protein